MNIGLKITELRKQKGWSQADLAKQIDVSRAIIGSYERNEAAPFIDAAKRMADAFKISLDYLVGDGQNATFDKKIQNRIQEIQNKSSDFRNQFFSIIDSLIRDYKTQQAYSTP
jgi:transcriptional regulator with XRE-family HTH domain